MKKTRSIKTLLITTITTVFLTFATIVGVTSFILYRNNITDETRNQLSNANQQMVNLFDTYFENLINVSSNIQSKLTNINLNEEHNAIQYYFDDIMQYKSDLTSIAVYSESDGKVLAHSSKFNEVDDPTNKDWFLNARENNLINNFSGINIVGNTYAFTISKSFSYNKEKNSAILKLDCDFGEMVKVIQNTDHGKGGHISIYNNDYNLIYCSSKTNLEEKQAVQNLIMGDEIVKFNDGSYFLHVTTLDNTTWKISILTNYDRVLSVIYSFLTVIIVTTFILIVIFCGIGVLISSYITNPIRQLQTAMAKVELLNYNPDSIVDVKGSKEVENLSKSFKHLMTKIDNLIRQLIEEENNKRTYELRALQNQINPHFLYNTLDSIVYLIDNNENEKASKMIIALSKFFRISISKGKNIIPISKEIEHVNNYLLIQKIRFGDLFTYNIDVSDDILDYNIVKLVLQPIVENSIIHGLQEMEQTGHIEVKGYQKNGFIHFDVIDNGYGILPEKVEEIYEQFKNNAEQKSVGFVNVYKRLRLYYGKDANIVIHSDLDVGTDIEIIIPIKGDKENEKK